MNPDTHVLVVEDDLAIRDVLKEYLSEEGYRISVAGNGCEMRRVIEQSSVDIVVLDVVLPGDDGLTLARWLQAENSGVGIIMMTGRGETIDRIIGLEMGADDYLVKPFHLRELLARIRSVKRRTRRLVANQPGADRSQLRFAGWLLDTSARELFSPVGENVRLTGGEFDLMVAFVSHPNQVLSRDQLLDLARDRETASSLDRTIDVQVGRLRRKLNDDPKQPHLIKTLRGAGYMFTVPVEVVTDPARSAPETCSHSEPRSLNPC
jgi:two-component system, OmpR family, response regulator